MNADGGGLRKLTNNHRIDTQPAWSPDGRTIAFIRDYTFLRYDQDPTVGAALWLMNASGANPRRVPLHGGVFDTFFEALYQPVWAPDGQHIAGMGIEWIPTQDYALWVFDLSGDPTAILPGHYDAPAWASDGDAVGCSYDGIHKLAAVDATDGDLHRAARRLLVPVHEWRPPLRGLRGRRHVARTTTRGRQRRRPGGAAPLTRPGAVGCVVALRLVAERAPRRRGHTFGAPRDLSRRVVHPPVAGHGSRPGLVRRQKPSAYSSSVRGSIHSGAPPPLTATCDIGASGDAPWKCTSSGPM